MEGSLHFSRAGTALFFLPSGPNSFSKALWACSHVAETHLLLINSSEGKSPDEAETPILWPPDVKNRLIGKDPDAGKD